MGITILINNFSKYAGFQSEAINLQNSNLSNSKSSNSPKSDARKESSGTRWTVGDMLWAKVSGHPWWPCMVAYDPSRTGFFRLQKRTSIYTWNLWYCVCACVLCVLCVHVSMSDKINSNLLNYWCSLQIYFPINWANDYTLQLSFLLPSPSPCTM